MVTNYTVTVHNRTATAHTSDRQTDRQAVVTRHRPGQCHRVEIATSYELGTTNIDPTRDRKKRRKSRLVNSQKYLSM